MVDAPHSPGPSPRPFGRPLSPHLQIYRWPITMVASIAHRATGLALAAGTLLLSWWLIAAATGPEAYGAFARVAGNPVGEIILFGFLWSLAFHLLNGVRHLAWDIGYGFRVPTAKLTAALVFGVSLLLAVGAFVFGFMVKAGFGV
jgi:succinate dehydrogenase / fumarate reductase cytochrome b subunit